MKQKVKRQENAKSRLESQLTSGVKTTKDGSIPLSDKDRDRMKKEISTLEVRIIKGK